MMMSRRRLYSCCSIPPGFLLAMEGTAGETAATDTRSRMVTSSKNRALATTSSTFGDKKWREQERRRAGGGGGGGAGRRRGRHATTPVSLMMAPLSSLKNYKLPLPSWSLADLKLGVGTQADDAAPALGRDEIDKLCALAHIELAPDGGEGLDAAAVQRDVGAMLRCMQTMRGGGKDGDHDGRVEECGEGGVVEDVGPWGGAMKWQAPLHEDVVSDGDMQKDILASAQRTDAGFFSAPRVVGGEETLP